MDKKEDLLKELALTWKAEDDNFFLDCDFSNDYVELETKPCNLHTWAIDSHELQKSQNLVSLFEDNYKNYSHTGFVPFFDMVEEMFKEKSFAPSNLDLGEIVVFDDVELSDVLSGVEGNFGNSGWVISRYLMELLKQYNIGEYHTYSLTVWHRNKSIPDYVYLHFHNYADKYIDYSTSNFYTQKGISLDVLNRSIIKLNSFEEIEIFENQHNSKLDRLDYNNLLSINPKELFLKPNGLDLFKFDKFSTIDFFTSMPLALKIMENDITGFEFKKTTKVKMF